MQTYEMFGPKPVKKKGIQKEKNSLIAKKKNKAWKTKQFNRILTK